MKPWQKSPVHLARIRQMDCCVCGSLAPSFAHHMMQGRGGTKVSDFLTMPLCYACHKGGGGIHEGKNQWKIHKMDEYSAMAKTVQALMR